MGTTSVARENSIMSNGKIVSKKITDEHGSCEGCPTSLYVDGKFAKMPIEIVDEHCHYDRGDKIDSHATRKLILASIICVLFMIAEVIGGLLSHSLAIAADAAHLMADFASFMISLFAIWIAQKKPSKKMSFGWHRAEIVGALISILTTWFITGIIVYMAVQRLIHAHYEIDAFVMLISASVGILVNIVMFMVLHQHSHPHSHKSSNLAHEKKNINVRSALIHVIGDFFQSIGVFTAAIIICFREDLKFLDPICTFLFSFLVLITTFSILKDCIIIIMEGMPRDVDFNDVLNTFVNIEGVVDVHNLRIWSISLSKTALSAHIAIKPGLNPIQILKIATKQTHQKYNFFEMTLQVENYQQIMKTCILCEVPL